MSDEVLYLYTEDFFIWPKLKKWFKEILGRSFGGPAVVFRSLKEGLKELGIGYVVNQPLLAPIDVACVLSGVSVLKWAIRQKKAGKIKKILAGPNIVISPSDFGGILKHPAIDKIIVPSEWVRSFYVQAAPELADKVEIWAAGVDVPEEIDKKKEIDFIVFNKIGRRELFTQIVGLLQTQKFKFKLIKF
ncbi:MAG: hypothetical protein M1333_01505, partial [Patescibacteria group bacterium]|nr:hypothetical protein [Patescibacteria group bacterium]